MLIWGGIIILTVDKPRAPPRFTMFV